MDKRSEDNRVREYLTLLLLTLSVLLCVVLPYSFFLACLYVSLWWCHRPILLVIRLDGKKLWLLLLLLLGPFPCGGHHFSVVIHHPLCRALLPASIVDSISKATCPPMSRKVFVDKSCQPKSPVLGHPNCSNLCFICVSLLWSCTFMYVQVRSCIFMSCHFVSCFFISYQFLTCVFVWFQILLWTTHRCL